MILKELMSLGDDNSLGRVIHDAKQNLQRLRKSSNKELKSLIDSLSDTLYNIQQDPMVVIDDGFTLMNYISQLTNPKITIRTVRSVNDALSSYENSSGE